MKYTLSFLLHPTLPNSSVIINLTEEDFNRLKEQHESAAKDPFGPIVVLQRLEEGELMLSLRLVPLR